MKKILALLLVLLVPALAAAQEESAPLDHAPVDLGNKASLQHGAAIFVNRCLNCHSASLMRYKRLEDLGLTTDISESFQLFQGLIMQEYERLASEFGFEIVDARSGVHEQQTLVRRLVSSSIDLPEYRSTAPQWA